MGAVAVIQRLNRQQPMSYRFAQKSFLLPDETDWVAQEEGEESASSALAPQAEQLSALLVSSDGFSAKQACRTNSLPIATQSGDDFLQMRRRRFFGWHSRADVEADAREHAAAQGFAHRWTVLAAEETAP